jgi:hypothetical protein
MVWVSGFPLLVWRVDEFGDIGRGAQIVALAVPAEIVSIAQGNKFPRLKTR